MAKLNKATEATATQGRPDVANMPRQSQVAFADYVHTLNLHAPDLLDELVDPGTITVVQDAIVNAGTNFSGTTQARIEKVIADKVAQAEAALTNEDKLNGYAGFAFDAEAFAKRTAPKTGRKRLSASEKAARVVDEATPEQLEALAELMKARGLIAPTAE